ASGRRAPPETDPRPALKPRRGRRHPLQCPGGPLAARLQARRRHLPPRGQRIPRPAQPAAAVRAPDSALMACADHLVTPRGVILAAARLYLWPVFPAAVAGRVCAHTCTLPILRSRRTVTVRSETVPNGDRPRLPWPAPANQWRTTMSYSGKAVSVTLLDDGIAELKFDLQGESVNKFNRETVEDLQAAVDAIKGDSNIKG